MPKGTQQETFQFNMGIVDPNNVSGVMTQSHASIHPSYRALHSSEGVDAAQGTWFCDQVPSLFQVGGVVEQHKEII